MNEPHAEHSHTTDEENTARDILEQRWKHPAAVSLSALRAISSENYVAPGKIARVPNPICQAAANEIEWLRGRVVELEQLHD